jgi:hypothetical protein
MGRFDQALAQFRRAGSDAEAYYKLAIVKDMKGDTDGAKTCLRLASAADPTFEPARDALRSLAEAERDPKGLMDNSPIVEDGPPSSRRATR